MAHAQPPPVCCLIDFKWHVAVPILWKLMAHAQPPPVCCLIDFKWHVAVPTRVHLVDIGIETETVNGERALLQNPWFLIQNSSFLDKILLFSARGSSHAVLSLYSLTLFSLFSHSILSLYSLTLLSHSILSTLFSHSLVSLYSLTLFSHSILSTLFSLLYSLTLFSHSILSTLFSHSILSTLSRSPLTLFSHSTNDLSHPQRLATDATADSLLSKP